MMDVCEAECESHCRLVTRLAAANRLMLLVQPSPATAERTFSILQNSSKPKAGP